MSAQGTTEDLQFIYLLKQKETGAAQRSRQHVKGTRKGTKNTVMNNILLLCDSWEVSSWNPPGMLVIMARHRSTGVEGRLTQGHFSRVYAWWQEDLNLGHPPKSCVSSQDVKLLRKVLKHNQRISATIFWLCADSNNRHWLKNKLYYSVHRKFAE